MSLCSAFNNLVLRRIITACQFCSNSIWKAPLSILLLCITGCGSNGDNTQPPSNSRPTALIQAQSQILVGQEIQLDGSSSNDAESIILNYDWSVFTAPEGASFTLTDLTSSVATFTAHSAGDFIIRLVVSDGELLSEPHDFGITATTENMPPVARIMLNQSSSLGQLVNADGSQSYDPEGGDISYIWSLTRKPNTSSTSLNSVDESTTSFTPDTVGQYEVELIVDDGTAASRPAKSLVEVSEALTSAIDRFDGQNPLLTTINNQASLPKVTKTTGQYLAELDDNTDNITLHFNENQGRLDATSVRFPFEVIVRNIGISVLNQGSSPSPVGNEFIFAGVQVHVSDLDSKNSSHVVVGHRGGTSFTIEGKNTVNGSSTQNDNGENSAPEGRADLRIVGNPDHTLTVYWQLPNLDRPAQQDEWLLYGPSFQVPTEGKLPGQAPEFGDTVYVGLITYAFGNNGIPFLGVCDEIEVIEL